MKFPFEISINFASLFGLLNKQKRDKLKLKYYDFLNSWCHGNRKSNTNT